jgi:ribosomal protein S18 acetylase RimI-like enzyme
MLPEPENFVRHFSEITRIHALRTSAHGGAFALRDGRGAAFWYPPGVHPDGQALSAVFQRAGTVERVSRVWEQVVAHEPDTPYWYLRQIGIDPLLQRGGHGGRLLRAGLAEVDRQGAIAYLEATSAPGKAFYERHGFVPLAEIRVDGSPPLWPMIRAAVWTPSRGVIPAGDPRQRMTSFELASAQTGASLRIEHLSNDTFRVTLDAVGLRAASDVRHLAGDQLAQFFMELASSRSGWSGDLIWASLEKDFRISANVDEHGHVLFTVELDGTTPATWSSEVVLITDLGDLDALSRSMDSFIEARLGPGATSTGLP